MGGHSASLQSIQSLVAYLISSPHFLCSVFFIMQYRQCLMSFPVRVLYLISQTLREVMMLMVLY